MSIAELARILDDGAKATNKRINRDHRNGLEPHEETLTQNFVSDYVARTRLAQLLASANEFTKYQEGRMFGADIALWFTNDKGRFAGIYLQAKVMRQDGTYRSLNHKNSHGLQHAMLTHAASRDHVLSGYAFYNGLRRAEPHLSACSHGIGSPDTNGISIASAALLGPHLKPSVPRLAVEGLCSPLSCLVRHATTASTGGGIGGTGGEGMGLIVDGNGGRELDSQEIDLPTAVLGLAKEWNQASARLLDRERIPDYVRKLAEQLESTDEAPNPVEPLQIPDAEELALFYQANLDPAEWSDLRPSFSAVLIGPQRDT